MSNFSRFAAGFAVLLMLVALGGAQKRTWVDSTGDFTIDAELVSVDGDKVLLRKSDGSEITVPLKKLSEKDREYLKGLDAEPDENAADDMKQIAESFYEDLRTTERTAAAETLTAEAKKLAVGGKSPLTKLPTPDEGSKSIRVGRVRFEGSTAAVDVRVRAGGKMHKTRLHFRKEEGEWKVFGISAMLGGEEKTIDFETDASGAQNENPILKLVGKELDVHGVLLNGRKFDWSQYEGKVVLVDFWATWCGPCMAEMPNVAANYKKYHDAGFEVVAISRDKDMKALKEYVAKENPPWTVLADMHPKNKKSMGAKVGLRSIPTFLLFDQDGKIAAVNCRGARLGKELEKLLGKERVARAKSTSAK